MILIYYNGNDVAIPYQENELLSSIIDKFCQKESLDRNSLVFMYKGSVLNEQTSNSIRLGNGNNGKILVYDHQTEIISGPCMKKSNSIICPECKENAIITIKDFQISFYQCKNGHKIDNVIFSKFNDTQKEDISKIFCGRCNRNMSNITNNKMYICFECQINLCILCKNIHDTSHVIKEYEQKNFICPNDRENFTAYCKTCKQNLCTSCESEHNSHDYIKFSSLLVNKKDLKRKNEDLKKDIDNIKNVVNNIKNKLDKVVENFDSYYDININLTNHSINNYRNYEELVTLNEINNNNNILQKELYCLINNNNINFQFNKIMDIYNKMQRGEELPQNNMINQNIISNNNISNNNINQNVNINIVNNDQSQNIFTNQLSESSTIYDIPRNNIVNQNLNNINFNNISNNNDNNNNNAINNNNNNIINTNNNVNNINLNNNNIINDNNISNNINNRNININNNSINNNTNNNLSNNNANTNNNSINNNVNTNNNLSNNNNVNTNNNLNNNNVNTNNNLNNNNVNTNNNSINNINTNNSNTNTNNINNANTNNNNQNPNIPVRNNINTNTYLESINNRILNVEMENSIRQDIIQNTPLVSEILDISSLIDEYIENDQYIASVKEIADKYRFIRKIRRDGNCFYRGFVYRIFEYICIYRNDSLFQKMLGKIDEAKILAKKYTQLEIIDDFYHTFFSEFFNCYNSGDSYREYLDRLFHKDNKETCNQLILFIRYSIAQYLREKKSEYEFIEKDYDFWLENEVVQMDTEVDNLQIQACFNLFDFWVKIECLNKDKNNVIKYPEEKNDNDIFINFLLRAGHYDLLYNE
jgi:hypothetical protein